MRCDHDEDLFQLISIYFKLVAHLLERRYAVERSENFSPVKAVYSALLAIMSVLYACVYPCFSDLPAIAVGK